MSETGLTAAQKAQIAKLREASRLRRNSASESPPQVKAQDIPSSSQTTVAKGKFDDLNSLDLTVSRQLGAWKDENFFGVRVYDVSMLSSDEAVVMGRSVVESINSHAITAATVQGLLQLAVSLRSTADLSAYLLTDINDRMTNKITLSQEMMQTVQEDESDLDAQQLEQLNQLLRRKKGGRSVEERLKNKLHGEGSSMGDGVSVSKEAEAAAYAYMAGFMLRLQCRDPEGVVASFETAKNRFLGFFDEGREILDSVVPTAESMHMIKEIISRKPEIASTWIAWAAYAENEKALVKQDRGLLEYLALQVFAYQGMHVVVQILSIYEITQYPLGDLLKELDCRMTRAAVLEVHRILRDHQKSNKNPGRKHYFRYARVWDEGYFSQVQSKRCAHLLYVAAKTVKDLGVNTDSDPTQIYALKHLSDTVKAQLDVVAGRLLAIVIASDNDKESASRIWKN
ncbi:TPA_asm: N [Utricularia alphacytorhabdovirus 1]|nr:TPA_asm: N [Utricularia alphacytorhabdovirus 1]